MPFAHLVFSFHAGFGVSLRAERIGVVLAESLVYDLGDRHIRNYKLAFGHQSYRNRCSRGRKARVFLQEYLRTHSFDNLAF